MIVRLPALLAWLLAFGCGEDKQCALSEDDLCIPSRDCRGQAIPASEFDADHCGDGAQCVACPNPHLANAWAACIGKTTCGFSCMPYYADCNRDPFDGCESSILTDPSNCGACGVHCEHGCVGGACALRWDGENHVAGLTDAHPQSNLRLTTWTSWDGGTLDVRQGPPDGGTPVTLASVPARAGVPAAVIVDVDGIYFTTGAATSGAVYRLRSDAPGPELLASGQDGPQGLLLTPAGLYWSNALGGKVMRLPLDGGTPEVVASGLPRPTQLAADDARVYWINEGFDGGDGSVMAASLGVGPATVVSLGDSGGAPSAISTVSMPDSTLSGPFRPHPIWADRLSRQIWTLIGDIPQPLLSPSTVPAVWGPRQMFPRSESFYVFDAAGLGLYVPDRIYVAGHAGYEPPFSLLQIGSAPAGTIALSAPWGTLWTDGSTIQQFQP